MSVKIGVPSKGRLMEKSFDWFAERGITMKRTGAERDRVLRSTQHLRVC